MERETITKQSADIKADINTIQKGRIEDQHHLLKHKNLITMLQQASKDSRLEIQQLKKKIETRKLKLAPTSSTIPRSSWQFHYDSDTYPILKSMNNK